MTIARMNVYVIHQLKGIVNLYRRTKCFVCLLIGLALQVTGTKNRLKKKPGKNTF